MWNSLSDLADGHRETLSIMLELGSPKRRREEWLGRVKTPEYFGDYKSLFCFAILGRESQTGIFFIGHGVTGDERRNESGVELDKGGNRFTGVVTWKGPRNAAFVHFVTLYRWRCAKGTQANSLQEKGRFFWGALTHDWLFDSFFIISRFYFVYLYGLPCGLSMSACG